MKVKMKDELAAPSLDIKAQFIARLSKGIQFGYLFCLHNHLENNIPILFCNLIDASDMFSGDDEEMNRRIGPDVFDHD